MNTGLRHKPKEKDVFWKLYAIEERKEQNHCQRKQQLMGRTKLKEPRLYFILLHLSAS